MSKSMQHGRKRVRQGVRLLACVAALGMSAPIWGEVVKLKDGSAVEGTVKRTSDGYDVTDSAGKVTHVDADNVKGIELSNKVNGVVEAESRLASLRRSVENLSDIKGIIERYDRFIDQNKQSAVGREAEHDLAQWHERQEKGMVKVGAHWVTQEERTRIVEQGLTLAEDARQLVRQSRFKDADAILVEVLANDPANIAAAYLRGIVSFKQEQLQVARKMFETVLAAIKDHAPTLNNLAVILWRQNQQMGALNFYVQAMTAAPLEPGVLNNVAEALNGLPQKDRGNSLAQKCARIFTDQDTALQQQMAQQGWYRWGSTWVDKQQIQQLQAMEKEIQKKLDAMSADYDELKKKISRLDDDIDDNVRRMKTMEDTSYARDPQGNIIRLPLPRRYFDLAEENKKLSQDRSALMTKVDEMRAAAKQLQQQIPTPRFTGVQRMIGVEGTPLLPPMKLALGPGIGTPQTAGPRPTPEELAPPKMAPLTPGSRPATQPSTTQPSTRNPVPDSLLAPQ